MILLNFNHIFAADNDEKEINTYKYGFGISAGTGIFYGAINTGYGLSLDYYFFNTGLHHVSVHGAMGFDPEAGMKRSLGYAGTVRYGIGDDDRFIVNLIYGKNNQGYYESQDGKITDYRDSNGQSVIIGYQRILPYGFTLIFGPGITYMDEDQDFRLVFLISAGYIF